MCGFASWCGFLNPVVNLFLYAQNQSSMSFYTFFEDLTVKQVFANVFASMFCRSSQALAAYFVCTASPVQSDLHNRLQVKDIP